MFKTLVTAAIFAASVAATAQAQVGANRSYLEQDGAYNGDDVVQGGYGERGKLRPDCSDLPSAPSCQNRWGSTCFCIDDMIFVKMHK